VCPAGQAVLHLQSTRAGCNTAAAAFTLVNVVGRSTHLVAASKKPRGHICTKSHMPRALI
jgi:hypothetical protein